jgi:transposase-like protein
MRVATAETGPASNEFFADLVARGLSGVRLVTRFNLMGVTPKAMWPAVKAMLWLPADSVRTTGTQ